MQRRRKLVLLWGLVSIAVICFVIGVAYPKLPFNSNMAQTESLDATQKSFVEFMVPKIDVANQEILSLRRRILAVNLKLNHHKHLSDVDRRFLTDTAKGYKLTHFDLQDPHAIDELLKRVDVVPTSLVLAQAADESGWGASHFAQNADNFFGQHCYSKNCGVSVGLGNLGFEVQKFNDVQDAINTYLYNLNTGGAYESFRDARAALRATGQPLTGVSLLPYLESYSVLGEGYISMINALILAHGFSQYDQNYQ